MSVLFGWGEEGKEGLFAQLATKTISHENTRPRENIRHVQRENLSVKYKIGEPMEFVWEILLNRKLKEKNNIHTVFQFIFELKKKNTDQYMI